MSRSYSVSQTKQIKKVLKDVLKAGGSISDKLTEINKIMPDPEDTTRKIKISKTAIVVNFHTSPELPSKVIWADHGIVVGKKSEYDNYTGGWASIERRANGLYVNDRRVVLHRIVANNKRLNIYGLKTLAGKSVLSTELLDVLYDNRYLIPEDWKKNKAGRPRFNLFWSLPFQIVHGNPVVRSLYLDDNVWQKDNSWVEDGWDVLFRRLTLLVSGSPKRSSVWLPII